MTTWDINLAKRGVELTPAVVAVKGQVYYQLVEGAYLDVDQSQGRHHVYVDVIDEQGKRLAGIMVRFWNGGAIRKPTELKPGELHAVDFPMFASGWSYGVAVDGLGDSVFGMGLGTPDQPQVGHHVSYRFVFQRTKAGQTEPELEPEPLPPTLPPVDNARLIVQAMDRLQRGQDLSERALAEVGAAMALLNQARGPEIDRLSARIAELEAELEEMQDNCYHAGIERDLQL